MQPKDRAHHRADHGFIFDQQHCFVPRRRRNRNLPRLSYLRLGGNPRQIDLKTRSLSRLTVNRDGTAALLHNPIDSRKSKPGPLAFFFGGKEGFEEMGPDLRIHSASGVFHRQHHVWSWLGNDRLFAMIPPQDNIGCFEKQLAALGHGVARIDGEIHNDLLKLPGISLDYAQPWLQDSEYLDVLAEQPPQHAPYFTDDLVQVQRLRRKHLPTAEGQ